MVLPAPCLHHIQKSKKTHMTHRWSLLDDFLVSSLDAAVSLKQVHIVAVPVSKYLHLNVPIGTAYTVTTLLENMDKSRNQVGRTNGVQLERSHGNGREIVNLHVE